MSYSSISLLFLILVVAESGGSILDKYREGERFRTHAFDNQKGRCLFVAFHEDYSTWCTTYDQQVYVMKSGKWELVHGNLKYVSVGEAGVWGVSSRNEIFFRQGVSKEKPEGLMWTRIDGDATHVSSGPHGIVWIIKTDQRIAYRTSIACGNPTGLEWKEVEGVKDAVWSSCDKIGCWALLRQGHLLHTQNFTSDMEQKVRWVQVDQKGHKFKYLKSSLDGRTAIATDDSERIYAWNGNLKNAEWAKIGTDRYLYAIPMHFGYLACKADYQLTFLITPPKCNLSLKDMESIQAGRKNTVCGLSNDRRLYQKQGKLWVVIDGSFKQVSCADHQIWAIGHYNNVYFRTSTNCSTPYGSGWRKLPGTLKRIDVGSFGNVHGIDMRDRILRREDIATEVPGGKKWTVIPGRLNQMSCYDSACWGVDTTHNVYMSQRIATLENDNRFEKIEDGYNPSLGVATRLKFRKIVASSDSMIWGVTEDNVIYFRMGVSKMNPRGSGWMYLLIKTLDVAATTEEFYTISTRKEMSACKFVN